MKKRPLLCIEWVDTAGGRAWEDEDTDFGGGIITQTVGWKIQSNRQVITVASTRTENGLCTDRETIPRKIIKSIRRIE